MNQMLLLVSVLIALFLMSTKEGKKVVKDVSKSVSSVAGQKGKGGFPSGIVLILVLVALLCLSRKGLVEGGAYDQSTYENLPDFPDSDGDGAGDGETDKESKKDKGGDGDDGDDDGMNECVEAVDDIKVMVNNLKTRLDSISK